MQRRVVITGVGLVTPIGIGKDAFWDSLRHGRSGVRPVTKLDVSPLPCRFAAEVHGFEPKNLIRHRKSLKVMAQDIQWAVASAELAVRDAELDTETVAHPRFGVSFGGGLIPSELDELGPAVSESLDDQGRYDIRKWGSSGLAQLFPLWMLKYLPNMLACHISIFHDAQGPNNTITMAEASGHMAVGEAFRVMSRGDADVFIAGGADSKVTPLGLTRLCLLNALSGRNDAPERACRPFDADRDGTVAGEGAAAVILEDLDHAKRRGARIHAELVGFGASCQRADGLAGGPTPEGIALSMDKAIAGAGLRPEDISLVCAHGLSDRHLDVVEAQAIRRVFGAYADRLPVTAPKSFFGNLGAGAGAVELVAAALCIANGTIAPTLNYERPDPECPLAVVPPPAREADIRAVISTAFTVAGQVGSLVLKKFDD